MLNRSTETTLRDRCALDARLTGGTHVCRVLHMLHDGRWHTHREGYALNVMLHSRVSDLRRLGYGIEQRRNGGHYEYRLVSRPALDDPPVATTPSLRVAAGAAGGSSSAPAHSPSAGNDPTGDAPTGALHIGQLELEVA